MYYICVEDNRVISVLDYEPAAPDTVTVVPIGNEDFAKLNAQTHYFDIESSQVLEYGADKFARDAQEAANRENLKFLKDTDWKVLRHIRQKALGIPTSLSEAEYLDLELERNRRASAITH